MKIEIAGPNQTEVTLDNGNVVLVSYQTPVAALIKGEYFRTEVIHSKTTQRHINRWIGVFSATKKPQKWFDKMLLAKA